MAHTLGTDGSIHSTNYPTGHVTRYAEWSTGIDSYGRAQSTIALFGLSSLQSSDVDRMTQQARKNIRAYLGERGELGKGYRVKLAYQLDTMAHPESTKTTTIVRFWEL